MRKQESSVGKGRLELFSDGALAIQWLIPDRRIEPVLTKTV